MSGSSSAHRKPTYGPFTLWCGLTFPGAVKLLRIRPALACRRWLQIAMLPGAVTMNSMLAGVESLLYGRRIRRTEIDPSPLIVLGHWRSGTTLLHSLLVNDPRYSFCNTFQCFFPFHFLTTEWWLKPLTARMMPKSRPMDNVAVGWDSPQEDEMPLCLMTMLSPYVMALRPDHLPTYGRFFNPDHMTAAERDEYQSAMRYYFRKLAVKDPRPLCLKSPGNTFRMRMLNELFPTARYVYIYRDPLAVIRSSIHLRRTMNEENSLGDRDQPDIETEILDVYEDCLRCYERDRSLIPPDRLYEMRYETLDADPLGELGRMYAALNLHGFESLSERLRPQLAEVKAFQKNRYEKDPEQARRIHERLKFAYDRFGYEAPPTTPQPLQAVSE